MKGNLGAFCLMCHGLPLFWAGYEEVRMDDAVDVSGTASAMPEYS